MQNWGSQISLAAKEAREGAFNFHSLYREAGKREWGVDVSIVKQQCLPYMVY